MPEPVDPTSDEALIATEQHCIAMLRYLRLPAQLRTAVQRHLNAAAEFLGESRRGEEPSERVYETAQRLAEGLRTHPGRQQSEKAKGTAT